MSVLHQDGDLLIADVRGTFLRVFVSLLCAMSLTCGGLFVVVPFVRTMATSDRAIFIALGLGMLALGALFSQVTVDSRVAISRTARTMVTTSRRISLQRRRTEVSLASLDHVSIIYRTGGGLRQAQAFWYIDLVLADKERVTVMKRVRDPAKTVAPEHVRAEARRVAEFLGVRLV